MRLVSSAYNINLAFLAVTTVGKSFIYNKKNKGSRIERESGKTVLFPVPDRTADTLMAVIGAWIEPDTTAISDCWVAYRDLDTEDYTHHTVNHTTGFADEPTGAHTNTIESTWRHVKAFLSPYNRKGDYTSPSSLYVRGEVQGTERGPIHKLPPPRRHNQLEGMSNTFRVLDDLCSES